MFIAFQAKAAANRFTWTRTGCTTHLPGTWVSTHHVSCLFYEQHFTVKSVGSESETLLRGSLGEGDLFRKCVALALENFLSSASPLLLQTFSLHCPSRLMPLFRTYLQCSNQHKSTQEIQHECHVLTDIQTFLDTITLDRMF